MFLDTVLLFWPGYPNQLPVASTADYKKEIRGTIVQVPSLEQIVVRRWDTQQLTVFPLNVPSSLQSSWARQMALKRYRKHIGAEAMLHARGDKFDNYGGYYSGFGMLAGNITDFILRDEFIRQYPSPDGKHMAIAERWLDRVKYRVSDPKSLSGFTDYTEILVDSTVPTFLRWKDNSTLLYGVVNPADGTEQPKGSFTLHL